MTKSTQSKAVSVLSSYLSQDVNTRGTPSSADVLSSTSGLMMAAMSNQAEVVERLLRVETVDVNMRGMQENTALSFAAGQVSGNHTVVLYLTFFRVTRT